MFVASNRNRSPTEHSSTAVEHIHHANPGESRLAPARRALGHEAPADPVLPNVMGSSPCPG